MKLSLLFFVLLLIDLTQSAFTDVPSPPKRPDRFNNRDELRRFFQKVHEYHLIVGRWRLRRGENTFLSREISNEDLFRFFDINKDHSISMNEFVQRLHLRKEN